MTFKTLNICVLNFLHTTNHKANSRLHNSICFVPVCPFPDQETFYHIHAPLLPYNVPFTLHMRVFSSLVYISSQNKGNMLKYGANVFFCSLRCNRPHRQSTLERALLHIHTLYGVVLVQGRVTVQLDRALGLKANTTPTEHHKPNAHIYVDTKRCTTLKTTIKRTTCETN